MRRTHLIGVALLVLLLAAPGYADVITFTPPPPGIDPSMNGFAGSFTAQGFTFTSPANAHIIGFPEACPAGGCVTNGTNYLGYAVPGTMLSMTAVGGGSFTFSGFDASRLFNDNDAAAAMGWPNADAICFNATLSGGGMITSCLALGLPPGFASYSFGPLSVTSVDFYGTWAMGGGGNFALDNIVVNEVRVPEPATLILFTAGLAGIGLLRRRTAQPGNTAPGPGPSRF